MKRHPDVYKIYKKMLLNPTLELREASSIKRFTKRAQGFGFGYNNPGQTNYSVPNSEGSPGTGLGQLDPTNPNTPSSSYTDKAMMRAKQRKEEEEARKRRELRKKVVNKIVPDKTAATPAKPGEALVVGPEGTKPGETIEKLTRNIDDKVKTIDRSLRTTEKEHEMAGQWTAEEQSAEEAKVSNIPQKTDPSKPATPKPATPTTDTGKTEKDFKSTIDKGVKETKTLSDATKKVEDNVNSLNKALQTLLQ